MPASLLPQFRCQHLQNFLQEKALIPFIVKGSHLKAIDNFQNTTLIHWSIFCRWLYKVPHIFYMSYFITGFAPNGTTAGVHQPEVLWPRSIACLRALNTAFISSEMSHYIERHSRQDLQLKIADFIFSFFLRITFFCFKISCEMKESKVHFQEERPYSSWMKSW